MSSSDLRTIGVAALGRALVNRPEPLNFRLHIQVRWKPLEGAKKDSGVLCGDLTARTAVAHCKWK